MNRILRFIDTGYWLGLATDRDPHHERAVVLSRILVGPFVTTEAVLLELGNAFSGARFRALGVRLLNDIRTAPDIEVTPLGPDLLARAIDLYAARPDKEWGLTDCVSFVVMQERGIHEALAADQHFVQAGFRALLRD